MSQLSNKNLNLINKVSNLFLRAKLVVEGFIIGLHKSPYHGFSVEFSEHKSYGYGDETKYIDWKLWAKTDKLFIKQFEEETNLKCHIIFDKSSSMGYSSKKITKFEYSKDLAAALSYLMIKQQDAVGLHMFDDKIKISIPPKSKKIVSRSLLLLVSDRYSFKVLPVIQSRPVKILPLCSTTSLPSLVAIGHGVLAKCELTPTINWSSD